MKQHSTLAQVILLTMLSWKKLIDAVVVPLDAGWSDIGSWSSLWDISEKDNNGNAVSGDVKLLNTNNSFI